MIFKDIFNRLLNKLAFVLPGGSSFRPFLHKLRGVNIGKNVWIGQSVYIDELHPEALTIHDNCTIGLRSTIYTHFYWGKKRKENFGKVVLEKNVYVGPHCLILPNVTIGEGSVIRGGTVVSHDVPPHTLWGLSNAGPLARVTTPLTTEYKYEEFVRGLRPLKNEDERKKTKDKDRI